jgi:hypothetical protein
MINNAFSKSPLFLPAAEMDRQKHNNAQGQYLFTNEGKGD